MLQKRKSENLKNLLLAATFQTWQTLSVQGHIKKDWLTYAKTMGVIDRPKPLNDEEKKIITDRSLDLAKRIAGQKRK